MINLVIVLFALIVSAGNVMAEESGADVLARYVDPLESQKGKIYTLPKIRLTDIAVADHELLTVAEIDDVVRPYRGKDVSFEQLEQIRHELTRIVVSKGYINSGVIIPDQEVKDGIVRFEVVHGRLTAVTLDGNRHFATWYLKSKLERGTRPTVNLNTLQENLQLLQLNPNIKSINAEFVPGQKPGESTLKAHIEERHPYSLWLGVGNSDPPATGSYRGDIVASWSNLIGTGDLIEGRFGMTEGNKDYGVRIVAPLNSIDTTCEAYFRRGENTVIQTEFSGLDIKSRDNTYGMRLSQPFIINLSHRVGLSLAGEYRTSTTTLLGDGFSFSEGADDGKSKETVIRFGQEYLNRSLTHVLAFNSTLSFGIDAFDSTVHSNVADGRFFTWLAQLLYLHQMRNMQLVFRDDVQLSNDPLLAMEKFSIGGIGSVRGYRRSLFVRDNGLSGSVELRVPVYTSAKGDQILSLIPFYDYGYSWNNKHSVDQSDDFIHSVGAGFRFVPIPGANVEFYYGYALRDIDMPDNDPQDYGIHFQVSMQVF